MLVSVRLDSSQILFRPNPFPINQCFNWRSAVAHFALMSAFIVVVRQPLVQIFLQLLQRLVQLFAEGHLIKLVQDRLMKPLADPIRLRRHRFGFRVVDIINRQI